jgi:hypothetical protein
MLTFFSVHKRELDYDEDVKSQLHSLAQQMQDSEEEYYFLPKEEYKETFVWVLETNHIPYRLNKTLSL